MALQRLPDDMKNEIMLHLTAADILSLSLACKDDKTSCENKLKEYKEQSKLLDTIFKKINIIYREIDKTIYIVIPAYNQKGVYYYSLTDFKSLDYTDTNLLFVRPDQRIHQKTEQDNNENIIISTQFKILLMTKIYDQVVTHLQTNPDGVTSDEYGGELIKNLHGNVETLKSFVQTLLSYLNIDAVKMFPLFMNSKRIIGQGGGRKIKTQPVSYKPTDRRVTLPGKTRKSIVYVKRGHDYVKMDSKFVSLKKVMSNP